MNTRIKRLLVPAVAMALAVAWVLHVAPLDPPESRLMTPGAVILDASGAMIYRDVAKGLRIPVSLDNISPIAVEATIASEDQRFWAHPGIDPFAVVRAAVTGHGGASTITQQLARRLYLRDFTGPGWERKAREALLALQLEARYPKRRLLELYLNDVYYGRGAYGIEAAARVYFDVAAMDLDLAQASLLAGLPQLPGRYEDSTLARARQAYVLSRLGKKAEFPTFNSEEAPQHAPHFVQYTRNVMLSAVEAPGGAATSADTHPQAFPPGLVIETTLDLALQREAERSVRVRLEDLKDKAGNAAVVVMESGSGKVLAMVGNGDFWDGAAGQVNIALQPRQPGSALKPFLYAAAFERGYTAATPILDVPTNFQTPEGPYAPLNFDRRFHGVVPLRVALAASYNVPAVRVLDEIGVETFLAMANRFGLHTLGSAPAYGLALPLGGGEVTLLELTGAYTALAASGVLAEPVAVTRVRDTAGRVLYEAPQPARSTAISPEHAYLLADILSDPAARQPGFGHAPAFDLPFRAAVKTGTSTGARDNWALGFTSDRTVGVWVGNAGGEAMPDVSGVDGAGPIWRDVMLAAAQRSLVIARSRGGGEPAGATWQSGGGRRSHTAANGDAWLSRPADLLEKTVCSPTGLLPGPYCPSPVRELFVRGTEPVEAEQAFGQDSRGVYVRHLGAEATPWALDAGVLLSHRPDEIAPALFIVHPAEGAVLYRSPELPHQEAVLRAAAPVEAETVEFLVDGVLAGAGSGQEPSAVWTLQPGPHQIEVVAHLSGGVRLQTAARFEVR